MRMYYTRFGCADTVFTKLYGGYGRLVNTIIRNSSHAVYVLPGAWNQRTKF